MIHSHPFSIPVFLVFVLTMISADPLPAIERVSTTSTGAEANGQSQLGGLSVDGRYVVFESLATNLVADKVSPARDIYVKDRLTGQVERVSVDANGGESNATSASDSAISRDGSLVVFASDATDLVPGDNNGMRDVFAKNRLTGAITLVSVTASGTQANKTCHGPVLSGNGRYVVFESQSTNLVAGGSSGSHNIFMRDLQTGAIEQISVDSDEIQLVGSSYDPSVSRDGSFVAFTLEDFSPSSTGFQIHLRNRAAGTSMIVSRHSNGTMGNNQSFGSSLTPDGRYLAFWSDASNLVDTDSNFYPDVFVRDLEDEVTTRVSLSSSDGETDNSSNRKPSISDDGRFVVFASRATNLVTGDNNGKWDVFLRDRDTGTTVRLSVDGNGGEASSDSLNPVISPNGAVVAFHSNAPEFDPTDMNGTDDVFVVANPFFTATYQPDNLISASSAPASGRGGDIYNTTGAGQLLTLVSKRARTVRGYLHIENDGNSADSFGLRGTRGNATFRVQYSAGGSVTGAVTAGTHVTAPLSPGGVETVLITVRPKKSKLSRKIRAGRRKVLKWKRKTFLLGFTTSSQMDPAKTDRALLKVKHR